MTNSNDWFIVGTLVLVAIFVMSLQLELSVATLMSGHSLGRQTSRRRLNQMLNQFTIGFMLITWLMFASVCLVVTNIDIILQWLIDGMLWVFLIIALLIQATVTVIAQARHPKLPHPWLPKDMRTFLTTRATKTKSPAEAFSLGVTSLLACFSVLTLPLIVAAIATMWYLPGFLLVVITILFSLIVGAPLVIMQFFVLNDTPISAIQRFTIKHRRFFQIIQVVSLLLIIGLITSLLVEQGVTI
ncbi:MAG: hypothetical protein ACOX0Z_00925 [Candidatus Nanosyncoccaceae bacterium]|jgi:MFS family permease